LFGEGHAGLRALDVGAAANREGWAPHGPIAPDERVENGAWPSADDATALRAEAWIR